MIVHRSLATGFFFGILVIGFLSSEVVAEAPEYMKRVVNVYGNVVATETPTDWPMAPAHVQETSNSFIMELLPEGQTLDGWEEMITILGRKGLQGSPRDLFTSLYLQTQQLCTEVNVAAQVFKEAPDLIIAMLMCGGVTEQSSGTAGLQLGQGELALYRIERRDGNMYLIFKSWRGSAYDVEAEDDSQWPTPLRNIFEYARVLERSHLVKAIGR